MPTQLCERLIAVVRRIGIDVEVIGLTGDWRSEAGFGLNSSAGSCPASAGTVPCVMIRSAMHRILFLCSRNRLRSPTAEQIFGARPGLEVASAGLSPDADVPCTPDLVEWADLIFVMEKRHRTIITRRFQRHLKGKRVICLDIRDDYTFMAPELIRLLEAKVGPHLPLGGACR